MSDLLIIESIALFCSSIAVLEPCIKALSDIKGIVVLPFLSFALIAAIHPLYGYRPELVPLTLVAFIHALAALPRVIDGFRNPHPLKYRSRAAIKSGVALTVFILATSVAMIYVPREERPRMPPVLTVKDESRGSQYRFFLTSAVNSGPNGDELVIDEPPILILPPGLEAAGDLYRLQAAFSKRGRSIISVERSYSFSPLAAFGRWFSRWAAEGFGRRWAFAADAGKRMETASLDELRFILKIIAERLSSSVGAAAPFNPADMTAVAFGSEASALILIGNESCLGAFVAVEPPLYAAIALPTIRTVEPPAAIESTGTVAANLAKRLYELPGQLNVWWNDGLDRLGLRPVSGTRALPAISVPFVFLASDDIRQTQWRDSRYAGLIRAFRTAVAPAAMASFAGADAAAFTDRPLYYPIYAWPDRTTLSGNAITALVELTIALIPSGGQASADEITTKVGLEIETNKLWHYPADAGILDR